MERKMALPGSVKNTAASARKALLDAHRAGGLTANTTTAWTTFTEVDQLHNDCLVGTPLHSTEDALAHAYDMLLADHSETIHTKIVVEKNRLETVAMVAGAPLAQLAALDTATLTIFGNMEAAEVKSQMSDSLRRESPAARRST